MENRVDRLKPKKLPILNYKIKDHVEFISMPGGTDYI